MNIAIVLLSAALAAAAGPVASQSEEAGASRTWRVYIGVYTGVGAEGIYLMELDRDSGALEMVGLAGKVENPSFLARHPHKAVLYSVGQGTDAAGARVGLASAHAVDSERGTLTLLNQQPTMGEGPCHAVVHPSGSHLLAANYGGGSAVALPIAEDGSLLPASDLAQHEGAARIHPNRQEAPHAHAVALDASGRFAYVSDLGLDKIMMYRFDAARGTLTANDPPFVALPPGAGPRHFAFHPGSRFAYGVNELDNTVAAFACDSATGRLEALQTIGTLPESFTGENTTAEIKAHPSGRFVYASNRGHDSIACFAVDAESGRLTAIGHASTLGKVPRNFNIAPDGRFLLAANQQSNTIAVFRIDPESGTLEATGALAEAPTPVCVLFDEPR